MASVIHTQNTINACQLSELQPGEIGRTRKEDPCHYIMRVHSGAVIQNPNQRDARVLGIDLGSGDLIVYDYQVIKLPEQDSINLRNE